MENNPLKARKRTQTADNLTGDYLKIEEKFRPLNTNAQTAKKQRSEEKLIREIEEVERLREGENEELVPANLIGDIASSSDFMRSTTVSREEISEEPTSKSNSEVQKEVVDEEEKEDIDALPMSDSKKEITEDTPKDNENDPQMFFKQRHKSLSASASEK